MSKENYLATVRKVEEQLLQEVREDAQFDVAGLVAIFSPRENGRWLAVFDLEETVALPSTFEILSIKQLLEEQRDLSVEHDGMVITFEALELVRPDIVTRGSRFYPIEQLYRRL